MALTPAQQAQERISSAKHILVVGKEHPSIDTIASVIAMGEYLSALKKSADIVIPGFQKETLPAFLPKNIEIKNAVGGMRTLHISVDISKTPVDEFLYDVRDGKLEITVVPKTNEWNSRDVDFKSGEDRYDLIIAIDSPDMKSLGIIAKNYADFLHRTTIINIDSGVSNENWGQINLINLNAVSTSEVLFELISEWNKQTLNEPIATAILAGMIAKTRSFRTANVTPRTLQASSQLVSIGAKREEIVSGLWKTRSVNTLKLWGRALSRLHQDEEKGIVWTMLSHKDFLETNAGSETLPDVIDELISYAPNAKATALIYENEKDQNSVHIAIATKAPHHAQELVQELGASGSNERAHLCLQNTNIIDATNSVINLLKKTM